MKNQLPKLLAFPSLLQIMNKDAHDALQNHDFNNEFVPKILLSDFNLQEQINAFADAHGLPFTIGSFLSLDQKTITLYCATHEHAAAILNMEDHYLIDHLRTCFDLSDVKIKIQLYSKP
jgi:hypothetical protein